jgi:hypothetical protein
MNTILFMINGVRVGASEIMIILLGLFVVFLILRNLIVQPER